MGGSATYDKGGGIPGTTIYADNVDFTGVTRTNTITTNGQLIIGSTAANAGGNHINIGSLTSPLGTLSIGYSSPNITLDLSGGSIGVDSFDVQSATAPGVDPVVPTAGGQVTVNGAVVANHSVVLETHSRAANAYNVEVQYATSAAATDGTKSGVAHFNSALFTVDASGFVSTSGTGVANTITGDSGGALSPTAGNWNILGLSGSKTSGSGSTLTIKSPPFSDIGATASSVLNSGEFLTGTFTRTTPVTAGLADGDLLIYVVTSGTLTIQLAATQVAHIGSAASSVAGTLVSNATGDSVSLRYQASTNDWWATSVIGTWTIS